MERPAEDPSPRLTRLHLLLAIQSAVVILVAINRRGDLTTGYVSDNEFLRWVDLINLLVLPVASIVGFVLLKRWLEARRPARTTRGTPRSWLAIELCFIIGVYVLGAGYGEHEVTNYLHLEYCDPQPEGQLCEIIIFHDDEFSHWLFFAGFVAVNGALLALQAVVPASRTLARADVLLLIANASLIALGIFANLAFEATGFDLPVVAILFAASGLLLWRHRSKPLFVYYAWAYGAGLLSTVAYKLLA